MAKGYASKLRKLEWVRLLIEKHFDVIDSAIHVWGMLGQTEFASQKPWSMNTGVTITHCFFWLAPGTIKTFEIVDFLQAS